MDRGVHKNRTYIEQTCRPKQFQKSIDINRRTDNQNHVDFVQTLDKPELVGLKTYEIYATGN